MREGMAAMRTEDPPRYLSPQQDAEDLGISVSTVKRWVDEGVLPAHKTAGGHRKLLRTEVLALARQGDLPHADLAALSLALPRNQTIDLETASAALLQALLAGNGSQVNAFVPRA